MKNKKVIITLIVLLVIVIIALTVFFIGLLNHNFKLSSFVFKSKVSEELVFNETYELDFNEVRIETDASNIEIKQTTDENIQLMIYGKEENMVVDTKNDILKIKLAAKKCIGFCFNKEISKVELYLPINYDKKITIDSSYGDINIDEFLNANMYIKEECGDVSVIGGNIVNVENNYGDITIEKANIATIEEDCGDIKIGTINEIKAKNSYGDIKINTINHSLDLENDCGDIKLGSINLNKDSFITDDLGDIEIGNTNEIYIDAKTSLGNVKINKNYNKSDVTLKIENDCGDIKVKN